MVLIRTFVVLLFTITEALGRQICGKALADILDLVCDGRGFHWVQREGGLPTIDKRTAVEYLSKRSSSHSSQGGGRGGGGGGVVQECCHKSCDISQLESYCAAPEGTYFNHPTGAPLSPENAKELTRQPFGPRVTELKLAQTTTPRPNPVTAAPVTTPRSVFTGRTGAPSPNMPRRYGKTPLFFFVRGMIRNLPTRTPVTRFDVQKH